MKSNLGLLLEQRGISLYRLQALTDIPYASLHAMANDQKCLEAASCRRVLQIADCLSLSVEELLNGDYLHLPKQFEHCFWDSDFPSLKKENLPFVIIRLYRYGGMAGMRYLESHYPKETIIESIKGRRDMDPRLANFLRIRFSLPKSEMAYYRNAASFDWRKQI